MGAAHRRLFSLEPSQGGMLLIEPRIFWWAPDRFPALLAVTCSLRKAEPIAMCKSQREMWRFFSSGKQSLHISFRSGLLKTIFFSVGRKDSTARNGKAGLWKNRYFSVLKHMLQ